MARSLPVEYRTSFAAIKRYWNAVADLL